MYVDDVDDRELQYVVPQYAGFAFIPSLQVCLRLSLSIKHNNRKAFTHARLKSLRHRVPVPG